MEMPADTQRANIPYQADYVAAKIIVIDRLRLSMNVHLLPQSFRLSIELRAKTVAHLIVPSIIVRAGTIEYGSHRKLYFL